jgi:hypothetical protein
MLYIQCYHDIAKSQGAVQNFMFEPVDHHRRNKRHLVLVPPTLPKFDFSTRVYVRYLQDVDLIRTILAFAFVVGLPPPARTGHNNSPGDTQVSGEAPGFHKKRLDYGFLFVIRFSFISVTQFAMR